MLHKHERAVQALSFTLFIHGFAGWFYIAQNAVFHPETLARPLTHLLPWPREDTFGIICFAVSFVSLFVYMLTRAPRSRSHEVPVQSRTEP